MAFLLSSLNSGPRFHVSIITGPGVMVIFTNKGFDQKPWNGRDPGLGFVQYPVTWVSLGYKIKIDVEGVG